MSFLLNPYRFAVAAPAGGGGDVEPVFAGFLVRRTSGTQSISATTTTTLTYDTEEYDTDGLIVPATASFTVPSSLNGQRAVLTAGIRMAADEEGTLFIYRDSTPVAQAGFRNGNGATVSSGTVLLTTGEVYTAQIYQLSAAVMSADARNFFACYTIGGG